MNGVCGAEVPAEGVRDGAWQRLSRGREQKRRRRSPRGLLGAPAAVLSGALAAVLLMVGIPVPPSAEAYSSWVHEGGAVSDWGAGSVGMEFVDLESLLPRSVAPGSDLAKNMMEAWTKEQELHIGVQHQDPWLGGGRREDTPARKLLQQASIMNDNEIPQYDKDEARFIKKNCAVDVVARINRACAVISETIPFYYVDQETRTLRENATLVSTTIRIVCWGSSDYPDPFADIDKTSYLQFSVGQGFKGMQTACGVNPAFKVQCFGSNDLTQDEQLQDRSGQAEPPDGKFSQVSVGGLHACALCNDEDTCAATPGGSMWCWGNNRMRQGNVPSIRQTSVVSAIRYSYVSAGYEHTCGFRTDNFLTCFGSNLDGQIRMPNARQATENQEDGFLSPATSYGCCHDCTKCDCTTQAYGGVGARCRESAKLSLGWYHTCVIRAGCDVQCAWTTSDCSKGTSNKWYDTDSSCFCASCVRPHEVECFGYGAWGNAISPPGKFKVIASSFDYTCAIYADCNDKDITNVIVEGTGKSQCDLANTVTCWGRNNKKQASPPADMCDAAVRALALALARINNTIFETPAPPSKRLPCVCTPEKGCDCLSQYPRLEFEKANGVGTLGASAGGALAAASLAWMAAAAAAR
uniref:Uncharacterized protein n=1 Tax=Hemiselmis andersenii TaxID=464988 RepID=A0A7S0XQI7_HEMAN|mmetsp:Transcript_14604/g.33729  ORF Transcript_14604/g.33729 Transcript_14604/m.33729 type:complete len:636 (+) Transcript_14604:3-1910(+)